MKNADIRTKLHRYIDEADNKKVKAMYTLLEESLSEPGEYSPEFVAELDRRRESYRKDGLSVSMSEMDARIKKILNQAK